MDEPLYLVGIFIMQEIWKDIIGYYGVYKINNFGEIKSLERMKWNHSKKQLIQERIMKQYMSVGYYKVDLSLNDKRERYFVHRLLAQAFINNPNNKLQVNHINGIKTDNRLENLEWVSPSENVRHAFNIGLIKINAKRILQMDFNGNIIREWESTKIAGQNGFRISCINKAITGMHKHHRGFLWKYL